MTRWHSICCQRAGSPQSDPGVLNGITSAIGEADCQVFRFLHESVERRATISRTLRKRRPYPPEIVQALNRANCFPHLRFSTQWKTFRAGNQSRRSWLGKVGKSRRAHRPERGCGGAGNTTFNVGGSVLLDVLITKEASETTRPSAETIKAILDTVYCPLKAFQPAAVNL